MRRTLALLAASLLAAGGALAQQKEIKVGYQPSPIQDASIAMFETWGAKNGVKITKVPNSYGVYVEKMTASLTSNSDQYDVIWHNDDWGQLWAHLLEPTDDIDALKYAEKWGMAPVVFANAQGQNTGRADGPDLQRLLLSQRPGEARGGAQDPGRAGRDLEEAAGRQAR
jgi:ABC-type glycerol-3-phosphate transport system substrate-binding protein